jgi:hypothetical protein
MPYFWKIKPKRHFIPPYGGIFFINRLLCNERMPGVVNLERTFMKKLYTGIVLCLILATACSKNSKSGSNEVIVGKWELRREIGGVAGQVEYAAGAGISFYFAGDGNFVQTTPTADREREGTFQLTKLNGNNYLLELNYRTFPNDMLTDSIRFESDDTMIILPKEPCCDIPTSFYKRVARPE